MARLGWFEAAVVSTFVAAAAGAQTTTRVSVDSQGAQGNDGSYRGSISADGHFVAFASQATNLVPGDTNGTIDIFVRDRLAGTTERASVATGGAQGNGNSNSIPSISADGRFVAFWSDATNLVLGDTNGSFDVFLRDRLSGTTERVSVDSGGVQGNGNSSRPSVSVDGRYVAFLSHADNLVTGDTNATSDIFVHDRQSGLTERASVATDGSESTSGVAYPSLSADGRYVAFPGDNLAPNDTNGVGDIYVRDRQNSTTERVNVSSAGIESNDGSNNASLSADGRYVAFESIATNLVNGDTNGTSDIFVRDRQAGMTVRVSVESGGVQGDLWSGEPSISADGRCVAFWSNATNLVAGDTNATADVFLHDIQTGGTLRVSVDSSGSQGNAGSWNEPGRTISADGRYVTIWSAAANLVSGDTNGATDIFVHDRQGIPYAVTVFCLGDSTGIPCPCGNTGQPGHGCDNSISTGGALLAGAGDALLNADTLVLTASNERPTAFSLFWQGGSEIAPRPFGDGVGCMGPPLKRMFFHNAVGGAVTAPQGADLPVSVRSAAVGDPIAPGSIRIYHVFYRDPDAVFCPDPAGATFNTSSGLRVLWGQ